MLRPVEPEERSQRPDAQLLQPPASDNAVPAVGEGSFDGTLLPRDHPKWNKDALTISQRARELIARLRPVAVKVLTFWDHRVRSIVVASRRIAVDPSGSYRAAP
jgi:hypothetical protein